MNTIEASKGKWTQILINFGVDASYLDGRHNSCPICLNGKDTYRYDNKNGSGSYFCGHCGNGFGVDMAMKFSGLTFKEAAKQIDEMVGNITASVTASITVDTEKIKANYRRIITECTRDDHLGYLKHRHINARPNVYFHKALPFYEDGTKLREQHAMIGILQNAKGEGVALHRTYINKDLTVTRKLTKGTEPLAGSAIRLYPATDVLGVAEGVETAASCHQLFDVPVWSVVSAPLMESFVPPEGVKEVVVFADNDAGFAGQKSAYVLAHKLHGKGYKVRVSVPTGIGDFNDIFEEEKSITLDQCVLESKQNVITKKVKK